MITFNNVLLGSISPSTLNILADNTFVPTLKSVFEFTILDYFYIVVFRVGSEYFEM